jgi:hypothetical protein
MLHTITAALSAIRDSWLAMRIAPPVYAVSKFEESATGSARVLSTTRISARRKLVVKRRAMWRVFREGMRLRMARAVYIPRLPNEGLLANFLHVLELLQRVRADAQVTIDWKIDGSERGFRYGRTGDDVWRHLWRPIQMPGDASRLCINYSMDLTLWGTGKEYLSGGALLRHRRRYHRTLAQWIHPANTRVIGEVNDIYTKHMTGKVCVGIHRRIENSNVPNLHKDGRVPPTESFIRTAISVINQHPAGECVVFLATDDRSAVPMFKRAFGDQLIVREHVRRTERDAPEVHFSEWDVVSLADAEDVLIDTMLLAACDVLLHASSSVSTAAALMNPRMTLVRVDGRHPGIGSVAEPARARQQTT